MVSDPGGNGSGRSYLDNYSQRKIILSKRYLIIKINKIETKIYGISLNLPGISDGNPDPRINTGNSDLRIRIQECN
jgi:hypothetical protein